ncbi:hypothetical protein [Amycolatopsis plumensis]|uniref:Uncharacterized protein n=1 Tax=Amycolatopsis plumensis TaxID=236508 RepID=A0ABV5TYS0_9PSEU
MLLVHQIETAPTMIPMISPTIAPTPVTPTMMAAITPMIDRIRPMIARMSAKLLPKIWSHASAILTRAWPTSCAGRSMSRSAFLVWFTRWT